MHDPFDNFQLVHASFRQSIIIIKTNRIFTTVISLLIPFIKLSSCLPQELRFSSAHLSSSASFLPNSAPAGWYKRLISHFRSFPRHIFFRRLQMVLFPTSAIPFFSILIKSSVLTRLLSASTLGFYCISRKSYGVT